MLILIFHLGLGQGRAAIETPVHRLEAPGQVPTIDNFGQRPNDIGLKPKIHREVRMIPVSENAHADKIGFLRGHLLAGVFSAVLAELACGHFMARLTDFLFDIQLNGQAVAVPARHVGRVKARQRF